MKTYEEERKELHDWIDMKNKEQFEIEKNDTGPTQGYDSPLDYERRKVVEEYNRRLGELKKKYGKEEPSGSVEKARIFGQAIHPPV